MVITFDIIREVQRRERESRNLQKLPDGFFEEVGEYLEAKEKGTKTAIDMIELENARLIINDLIDRREHKILEGAMVFVRSGILLENMTEKERELFNDIVAILKRFREEMWEQIKGRKQVVVEEIPEKVGAEEEEKPDIYIALKDLATFIWSDGKRYSIRKDDVVKLPQELTRFLVEKGVIAKVGGKDEIS